MSAEVEACALGNPDLPSEESDLIEFLRAHVGCCVLMAAKGDLARALLASDWLAARDAARDAALRESLAVEVEAADPPWVMNPDLAPAWRYGTECAARIIRGAAQ